MDVDNEFQPLYIVTPEKKSKVSELRDALKSVDELLLATDPDREGEAIAWHLLDTLKPKVPVRRMVFHEITEPAIRAAAANLRDLDQDLVDAQETRRILDRLYGYEVSPVLWKKVMPRLSAGRVQSVATRIIVQRERERMAFVAAGYWDIAATLDAGAEATPRTFGARLLTVDGDRVATGRDFGPNGQLRTEARVLDEGSARRLAEALHGRDLAVTSVESKPYTRKPYAPFMTSTLQQEAGRKLRFSAERTMRSAQRLYENGYITYMRTDSTTLSESAITAARTQARELYGEAYVSPSPRQYTRKVKNAQEAHEAIRPSGETFRTPGQVAREVDGDDFRLYELIWQRTVASQMADARGTTVSVRITGTAGTGEECVFAASGRTITFAGFLKAYVETVDDQAGGEADDAESRLPELTQGQALTAVELRPDGHTTNPPARYTEASLVKMLEELGIGRPSTYASIIKTIQDRGYVWKKGSALVPSWIAFAVIGLLEHHFGRLVDYDFTAAMEDELDSIASGTDSRTAWLNGFYFGGAQGSEGSVARAGGLKKLVGLNLEEIDAREINSIPMFDDVVVRVGRYGPYLERIRDGVSQRANLPDDLPPDELTRRGRRAAVLGAAGGPLAGRRPADRARDRREGGPVRALRDGDPPRARGAGRGSDEEEGPGEGQAAHGVAVQGHVGGDGDAGAGRPAAVAAAGGGHGPRRRRGDHRAERALRAVPQEGHRLAVADERRPAVHRDPGRGAGDLPAAQAARPSLGGGDPAAARAGRRHRHEEAHGDQGRPVRAVRHRRRDERVAAQGRQRRGDHGRACLGAAGRAAGEGPGAEEAAQPASPPPGSRATKAPARKKTPTPK